MTHRPQNKTVCIASLLATSDSCLYSAVSPRHLPTIGFDVDEGKINELFNANDNPGATAQPFGNG